MRRTLFVLVAVACVALAGIAALASARPRPVAHAARITDVGKTSDNPPMACPSNCVAMTRTTGYNRTPGAQVSAPYDGRLVAFTVRLGKPLTKDKNFYNHTYGGTARVQIAVVHIYNHLKVKVLAAGPTIHVEPWFGKTVQFPLDQSLPVHKGDVIALTVPTWAPVLSTGLDSGSSWRSSRTSANQGCNDFATQTAQTSAGDQTTFGCLYTTARIAYSAEVVMTPYQAPKAKTTASRHRHR